MSQAISGILVVSVLLLSSLVIFSGVLDTGISQGTAIGDAADLQLEQLGSLASIASATAQDNGGGTDVTVEVDNKGSISVGKFSQMDVLAKYTTQSNNPVITRLTYVTGTPGIYQWSLCSGDPLVCSISPDVLNPNMWDPDERATITLRLEPKVKTGSSGTVVVVMPAGVSDSTTFTN